MLAASAATTIATLPVFRGIIRELGLADERYWARNNDSRSPGGSGLSAAIALTASCFSGSQTFSTRALLQQRAMLAGMSAPLRGLYGGTYA